MIPGRAQRRGTQLATRAALLVALALAAPAGAQAVTVQEFSTASVPGQPKRISLGPGGDLYFTSLDLAGADALGRITTAGSPTFLSVPDAGSNPADLTFDGTHVYFTEVSSGEVGRSDGASVTESLPTFGQPQGIAVSAGKLFVADNPGSTVKRATAAAIPTVEATYASTGNPIGVTSGGDGFIYATNFNGTVSKVLASAPTATAMTQIGPNVGSDPQGITLGPDGGLWFAIKGDNSIGHMSTDGSSFNEFPIPTPGSQPTDITVGPDGALWFTENGAAKIGRITTAGVITEYTVGAVTAGIAAGPDGALWFTEDTADRVGRLVPDPPATPDTAAPETRITKKPKKRTTKRRARFAFESSEPGSTFECKLDRKKFKRCSSPYKKKVGPGKHKFKVRATDAAGNVDTTPAKAKWKVIER